MARKGMVGKGRTLRPTEIAKIATRILTQPSAPLTQREPYDRLPWLGPVALSWAGPLAQLAQKPLLKSYCDTGRGIEALDPMVNPFANLTFDLLAYRYGQDLDILSEILAAAEHGLQDRRAKAAAALADYEASGERIGEWEEGLKIWDHSDVLDLELQSIDEALSDFRKTFVSAFYHAWERMLIRWAGVKPYARHDDLCKAAQAKGITLHPRLDAVRDLNNALKHNSQKYGACLFNSWPEMFSKHFDPANAPKITDWYGSIRINESQMREIITALRASAPQAFPTRQGG